MNKGQDTKKEKKKKRGKGGRTEKNTGPRARKKR